MASEKEKTKFKKFINTFLQQKKEKQITFEEWMHYKDYGIYNLRR